jgi:hypothetical protein
MLGHPMERKHCIGERALDFALKEHPDPRALTTAAAERASVV